MQLGFCMLESGLVRTKNSINVAVKNLSDFCIATVLFWIVGFAFMFGDSWYGIIGLSNWFAADLVAGFDVAYFLFQLVFCATAATILSGAVAERMSFRGYLIITLIVSLIIYPISGHWIWNEAGWLAQIGYVDFAGSTAVHAVGGFFALAAVLVIGPRIGWLDGRSKMSSSHSLVIATFGVIVLFFGWFGFNGGSFLEFNEKVPGVLIVTSMAGAAGGMAAMLISNWRLGYPELREMLNGVIAGLVSVTACCHVISVGESILIGALGASICYLSARILEKFRVDDVVGASSAHGFPGIWSVLCVALFGDQESIGTGLSFLEQLGVQALGALTVFLWAFGIGYIFLKIVNRFFHLRIDEESERIGLNVAEHGATTEILDLLEEMGRHRERGDFSRRVEADPFTEVGQIASEYNTVIEKVALEILQREEIASRLQLEKQKTDTINKSIMSSIEYAQRIQAAILPDPSLLNAKFRESMVLYQPRDIVSGDFYWFLEDGDSIYIAVVDCTGHGVPGAFMSLIGSILLGDIVRGQSLQDPAMILAALHKGVRKALKQETNSGSIDGMDVALVRIDPDQIYFSGAKRPLYVIRRQGASFALEEIRGDRKSVGGRQRETERIFHTFKIARTEDMILYLTTDGYVDQPNADLDPFDSSRLKQLLEAIAELPMAEQRTRLKGELDNFRRGKAFRDDITLIGLRL